MLLASLIWILQVTQITYGLVCTGKMLSSPYGTPHNGSCKQRPFLLLHIAVYILGQKHRLVYAEQTNVKKCMIFLAQDLTNKPFAQPRNAYPFGNSELPKKLQIKKTSTSTS